MLEWSAREKGVKIIRYPKGNSDTGIATDGNLPRWKIIKEGESYIVAHGPRMLQNALAVADILQKRGKNVGVVNARFIAPYDLDFLCENKGRKLYVLEDVVFSGSLSERLLAAGRSLCPITLPNTYVTFGSIYDLHRAYGLDAESVAKRITEDEA